MVNSNNAINNTVGASISGVTNTLTVTNPSDTASSAARTKITVGGSTADDPALNFNIAGATDFEVGIDNDDSDKFKLSASAVLGTTDTFIMTKDGQRTMPLHCCFLATKTVVQTNVTGDGTEATCNYETTIFDQNSDYDGTSVFTAPVTGRYMFSGGINFRGIDATYNNASTVLVSSNRILRFNGLLNAGDIFNPAADIYFGGSCLVDMDAGDTAMIRGFVTGGTKTINFRTTGSQAFFSGFLIC